MNRRLVYLSLIIVVAVLAVAILLVTGKKQNGPDLSAYINKPVPQSLVDELRIPDNLSSGIGIGFASGTPRNVSGAPLHINGKPAIVYIGAEFCPFCAGQRWALIIALMRGRTSSGRSGTT